MGKFKRWLKKMYLMHIRRDDKAIAYCNYIEAGGEALRLDYALNKHDIVLDVGGYVGDFSEDIYNKFGCSVDVFEPVKRYADAIRDRLSANNRIRIIQSGLGSMEKEMAITVEGLGSSVFIDGREEERVENIKIISAVDYIKSKGYSSIGLVKINIEGGEYDLLDSLLKHPEIVNNIKYFQIQFHDFVPDADEMRHEICTQLSKTHQLMWAFPYIWESWENKDK